MAGKRPLSRRSVQRMREREALAGLEPDDEAAQWLAENDPPPPFEDAEVGLEEQGAAPVAKTRGTV